MLTFFLKCLYWMELLFILEKRVQKKKKIPVSVIAILLEVQHH